MKIKHLLLAAAAVCGLSVAVNSAFAQGTAFTYQGLLSNSNNLVTGSYDLTFKLFNASSGPAQVGPTVTNLNTGVTNGLFTVIIDFGAQFNGTPYWLEIGVRTNGGGAFATLTPRQELTPTPYAVTAENVDGFVSASQLTGTLPAGALTGVDGSGLVNLNASDLASGTLPDARLSANVALLNANQTFLETNVFNSGTGVGKLVVSNGFAGGVDTNLFTGLGFQYDSGAGEGALMSSFNNGQAFLSFYTKPDPSHPITRQMIIDRFGVVSIDQGNSNNGVLNNGSLNGAGLTFGTSSGEGIASQRTAGLDQFSLSFYTGFNNRMTILSNGVVGIGTTNPTAQLEVVNSNVNTSATGVLGVADGGSTSDTHPSGIFFNAGGEFAGANGLIGAATTNQTDGYGVIGLSAGSAGRGVYGRAINGGTGVYAESDGGGTGLFAASDTGTAVSAFSSSGSALTIGSGAIHVSGAGINTTGAVFTQRAIAANIGGDSTFINNPLCNNDPNAILIVTPNWNPQNGIAVNDLNVVGVWYTGTQWAIFHENGSPMITNAAFNVMIIKN